MESVTGNPVEHGVFVKDWAKFAVNIFILHQFFYLVLDVVCCEIGQANYQYFGVGSHPWNAVLHKIVGPLDDTAGHHGGLPGARPTKEKNAL